MAGPVTYTLATLCAMVRDFVGDPSNGPAPRWTDPELKAKLNIAADFASRVSNCILGERLENVTAGTPYVPLDAAIARIDVTQWKDGGGGWVTLYENKSDALGGEWLTSDAKTGDPRYFAVGGTSESSDVQVLYLSPTPDTTLTDGIRIVGSIRAAALNTDGTDDTKEYVGLPAAVAEILPEYVAWMVGHSDREFAQAQADLAVFRQRLLDAAGMVNERNAKRVKYRVPISLY